VSQLALRIVARIVLRIATGTNPRGDYDRADEQDRRGLYDDAGRSAMG